MSKPTRSPRAKPGRTIEVKVPIDAALRRAWKAALSALEAAHRAGASAFDRKYETLATILDHEPPLYLAGGYASASAFLAKVLAEDERSARRYIRVARYASPVEEERYTVSKLDAALAYLDAKTGGGVKGRLPVAFEKLRIPVRREDGPASVSLEEATVAEVRAATRALSRAKPGGTTKRPPRVVALVKALRAGALKAVSVSERGGKLYFGEVPVEHLAAFARALAKAKLPG